MFLAIRHGNWSDWGSWSDCSVSCGEGVKTRWRSCNNPAPLNGGKQCIGDRVQHIPCRLPSCTGESIPCVQRNYILLKKVFVQKISHMCLVYVCQIEVYLNDTSKICVGVNLACMITLGKKGFSSLCFEKITGEPIAIWLIHRKVNTPRIKSFCQLETIRIMCNSIADCTWTSAVFKII